MKKNLVVLSGAGISAESGIKTFRDGNGLWENHDIMEVASPEGWRNNRDLVLEFYNQRRKNVLESKPNLAHQFLVDLEDKFNVQIITQNIDNLHERAGSASILHLHGEITKSRSTVDPNLIYNINGWQLNVGDKCEKGSQLRPHIVWFGEMVPAIEEAIPIVSSADILLVIGTSLVVYPAAGLINYAEEHAKIFVINPESPKVSGIKNITYIEEVATIGMQKFVENYI